MFDWAANLGLKAVLLELREAVHNIYLPAWVTYSLPDGLWVYALTAFMLIIWQNTYNRFSIIWISMGFSLGIIPELLQLAGWFPGTFDINDLSLCALAIILAAILLSKKATLPYPNP